LFVATETNLQHLNDLSCLVYISQVPINGQFEGFWGLENNKIIYNVRKNFNNS